MNDMNENGIIKYYIYHVISSYSIRDLEILKMRWGLESGKPRTLQAIGEQYKLSRERIRQIEIEALSRLRHPSNLCKLKKLRNSGI